MSSLFLWTFKLIKQFESFENYNCACKSLSFLSRLSFFHFSHLRFFFFFFFSFLVHKLSFFSLLFFIFIFCFHWRQNMCRWCSLTAVKRHGWKIISKQITTPYALYRSTGSYKINPCSMSMVWRVFREITDVEEKRQIFGTIVCN